MGGRVVGRLDSEAGGELGRQATVEHSEASREEGSEANGERQESGENAFDDKPKRKPRAIGGGR